MTLERLENCKKQVPWIGIQKRYHIIYASNDGYADIWQPPFIPLLDHNRNIPRMDIYILSVGMDEGLPGTTSRKLWENSAAAFMRG